MIYRLITKHLLQTTDKQKYDNHVNSSTVIYIQSAKKYFMLYLNTPL